MLYYVSDIHVEHKIDFDALPDEMPEKKFGEIIAGIADKVFASTMPHNDDDYLLIAGDTCENTHIGHYFFGRLIKMWRSDHIIVVLGNHEMWIPEQSWTEEKETIKTNLNSVMSAWRTVFDELGIIMLQNETVELPKLNAVLLGGVGFSGQNEYFNASNGLYLKTLATRKQDKYQSHLFDSLYKKTVQRCEAENKKLVVLTHNPWRDWHSGNIKEEITAIPVTYFSGHTHKNTKNQCEGITGKKMFFADGQMGYVPRNNYNIKKTCI